MGCLFEPTNVKFSKVLMVFYKNVAYYTSNLLKKKRLLSINNHTGQCFKPTKSIKSFDVFLNAHFMLSSVK